MARGDAALTGAGLTGAAPTAAGREGRRPGREAARAARHQVVVGQAPAERARPRAGRPVGSRRWPSRWRLGERERRWRCRSASYGRSRRGWAPVGERRRLAEEGTQDWMNDNRPAAASIPGELFPEAHARAMQAASPVDLGLAAIKAHDPGFELEQFTQQVQRVLHCRDGLERTQTGDEPPGDG